MNPNSRTVKVIETSLARLEQSTLSPDRTNADDVALEALGLLDEIRRLERKWVEQIASASPRRKPTDFAVMEGWCRRWLQATGKVAGWALSPEIAAGLNAQRAGVERDLATDRFRTAAKAMRTPTSPSEPA